MFSPVFFPSNILKNPHQNSELTLSEVENSWFQTDGQTDRCILLALIVTICSEWRALDPRSISQIQDLHDLLECSFLKFGFVICWSQPEKIINQFRRLFNLPSRRPANQIQHTKILVPETKIFAITQRITFCDKQNDDFSIFQTFQFLEYRKSKTTKIYIITTNLFNYV